MNSVITTKTIPVHTVVLEMSTQEALWLKNVMQNPLYCDDPNKEDPLDRQNRCELFHTLPSFQELSGNYND